jgi:hypothetical protein
MALRKKLSLGAPGVGAPPQKTGRSPATKAPGPPTTPSMQSGGSLTTGEHPGRDAYFKRTGRTKDPLEAAGGSVQRSFVNQTAGPRKGQTALEVMKGGAKYHVYYGPNGTRSVFRVPTRGQRGLRARAGRTGASVNRI